MTVEESPDFPARLAHDQGVWPPRRLRMLDADHHGILLRLGRSEPSFAKGGSR